MLVKYAFSMDIIWRSAKTFLYAEVTMKNGLCTKLSQRFISSAASIPGIMLSTITTSGSSLLIASSRSRPSLSRVTAKKPLPLSEFASIQPNSLLSSPIITLIFSFIVESSFHFAIIVLIYMSRYFLTLEISPCSIYYHVFWQKSIHFGHFISINIRLIFRISEINLCISRCLSVTQGYSPFYA